MLIALGQHFILVFEGLDDGVFLLEQPLEAGDDLGGGVRGEFKILSRGSVYFAFARLPELREIFHDFVAAK